MPKYLCTFDYSTTGSSGLLKEGGTKREKTVASAIKALGGTLDCFYFAFGAADAVLILELPDNVSAAALSLAVGATGAGALRTTVLLTPQEIDAAAKVKTSYRAPGK